MSVLWGHMELHTARLLCVLIIVYGGICVSSKGERLSHYSKSTVDFYQRQTAGCSIEYNTEVMLTFTMSFLYGAKDEIYSSIKLILFCTIVIRLFRHYKKSQHFNKVFIYFEKSYFLFVCDICSCAISYGIHMDKAGHAALNLGEIEN